MGFFGQEHWGGLSCPPPGDLPQPGIEPVTVSPPALAGSSFTTSATWETPVGSISPAQSSRVRLFVTPWTAARQASLSITDSWS